MIEPKQIIEQIRKIRFSIGLDTTNLKDEQREALKDKEKILKDASKLAKEIHTKNPHFILELIQNAEDNKYINSVPKIKFIIDSEKLIIQNNENGFEEKNVWALCGIGESTKTKAMGYIGEKGIGFKSVFMIAEKVQIFSNGFQFGFNYNETEPITMIIPEWIDKIPDFIDPKQTNIVPYFKPEEKNEIRSYIKEIHPSLLLFLNKLKVIEIDGKKYDRKIEKIEKDGIIEITDNEKKSYWKVIRKKFKVNADIHEERRKDVKESEIILAFPLDENGIPDTSNEQYVFAFLPVRKYGFRFIIQADFILPITREDIIKDNKWNQWLRDSIIEVFLDAVKEFKNNEKQRYHFYDYLFLEEVKDEFFLPLVEQIYEKLKKEDCILTEANRWRKPSEVLIGDEEIKKLIPNEDLQKFLGKEYISEKIKTKKSVLNKLGVRDFSIDDLIKCLEKIEWVKNQNWEWFVNLFSYLSKEKFSDEQLEQIKNLSIIKLEAGELTSINEGIVFFPLEEKVTYGFENEIRVIKKDIIEIILKQGNKEEILEFFRELGLKKADPYEIIENHILPVYKSEIWKQKDSRTLIGYIRYIKDNIDRYERESDKKLKANKTFWEEEDIKESLLIRINKNSEGKEWYDNPKNIYLPKIYGNENDLEKLFEGINVGFVHNCYLEQELKQIKREIADLRNKLKSKKWKKKHKKEVKKIKTQLKQLKKEKNKKIEKWKKFLLKIGVNEIPKVEHYEGQILYKDKYPTAEEREYSTSTCNVKDWRLSKEFNELLERSEPEKIKILLTILDHNWKNKYSKYIEMNYQWFYYNERNKTLQSSFIRDLKEKIKVLTTKNTLARPTEVFLNKHEICEILGDTVPYLAVEIKNEDFIKTLGINTEANIDCVLNYLKALVEQKSKDEKKFEELYKFLDEHFDDEEEGNKIKEEFNEETLIFVPDSEKKYYSAKEVIWKDVSNIFGKNRVYLEKYYPKFKKFFVEKLGINEKPIPKDYADVLCSISKKEKISNEDKEIIIRIYEELNRNLNPNEVENPMFEEEWWEDFIKKPIFFTNKGDFWSNDRDIFINDNELYYELFKDEENIAFLWLPENYHPDKIKFFIKYSGLRYLSKNIEIKPLIEETIKYSQDKNFTDRIRNILPYVLRYLYWRENEDYEKLKMEGILQRIGMIEVNLVENLRVEYLIKIDDIKTIVKKSEKRCVYCYDCDKLFLDKKDGSIYDLAIEFSKIFGAIKGLDNFVMHIMENFSSIEKIMEAKNIKELPSQEKEILKTIFENKGGLEKKEVYTEKPEEKIFNKEKKDSLISQKLVKEQIENHEEKDVLEKLSDITKIEKKWTPEISPEEVPINVEEYKGLEQEIVKKFKKEKQHLKKETEIIKPPTTAIFTESLSKEAKENIGYWGEEYAFKCIKNELIQKYPDAILVDTEEGFKLMENRNVIVEVIWLNKKEESGKHYDIKIVEKDKEIFVEVKSTKEHEKTWFQVSKDQWRIMIQKKDSFYIYRVYSAGTKEANIKKIQDPAKLWLEGQINAYPIGIEI